MPQTKGKHNSAERVPTRRRTKRPASAPQVETARADTANQGQDLEDRLLQVGAILSKGFDLVEASMTLGVGLVSKLSSALQVEMGDQRDHQVAPYPEPRGAPPQGPDMGPPPVDHSAAPHQAAPKTPPVNYIMNRSPLAPGSPVWVSFTINNDSPNASREIRLGLEGFVGELRGGRIDAGAFTIEPETRLVAPLDFEKFTLKGAVPADAVGDAYVGLIVVSGEEGLRIPVRLVVQG